MKVRDILTTLSKRARLSMWGKGAFGLVGIVLVGIVRFFNNIGEVPEDKLLEVNMSIVIDSIALWDSHSTYSINQHFADNGSLENSKLIITQSIDSFSVCSISKCKRDSDDSKCFVCWDALKKDSLFVTTTFDLKIISIDRSR